MLVATGPYAYCMKSSFHYCSSLPRRIAHNALKSFQKVNLCSTCYSTYFPPLEGWLQEPSNVGYRPQFSRMKTLPWPDCWLLMPCKRPSPLPLMSPPKRSPLGWNLSHQRESVMFWANEAIVSASISSTVRASFCSGERSVSSSRTGAPVFAWYGFKKYEHK